jgi:hypothetical protein
MLFYFGKDDMTIIFTDILNDGPEKKVAMSSGDNSTKMKVPTVIVKILYICYKNVGE